MRFSVFLPPQAKAAKVPALYFLAGLTCTEETFAMKAGAQRLASELGLCLVTPDTSPRATRLPGDDASWDFGLGAGFYLDATEAPWSAAYQMERYVVEELPAWVEAHFPVRRDARSVMGHSMGGHGALTLALRNPGRYASVSAFAPIVAPSEVPWGQKAFAGYLGPKTARAWAEHDACQRVVRRTLPRKDLELLHRPGPRATSSSSASSSPSGFEAACAASGAAPHACVATTATTTATTSSRASMDEHLRHHANALGG
jgi:S-formylglutathione hydrolase